MKNLFLLLCMLTIFAFAKNVQANDMVVSITCQTSTELCFELNYDFDSLSEAQEPFTVVLTEEMENPSWIRFINEPGLNDSIGIYSNSFDITSAPPGYYALWVQKYNSQDDSVMISNFKIIEILVTGAIVLKNPSISIYPNPTSNALTISGVNETHTVSLYDLAGKEVFKGMRPANDNEPIRFNLPTGIYTYQIQTESGTRKTGRLAVL